MPTNAESPRDRLLSLASRLTARDEDVLRHLDRFRVLTTHQVRDIAFGCLRDAQLRLAALRRLGAVASFRPVVARGAGSAPYHWLLDRLGILLVAAARGVPVRQVGLRPEQRARLVTNLHRPHHVEVNGFATALIRSSRQQDDRRLAEWATQWECARRWGDLARPDGYGRWIEHDRCVSFLLEHDRGTENIARVAAKLDDYAELAPVLPEADTCLLLTAPDSRRESAIRRAVAGPGCPLPLATATYRPGGSPAEAIWTPLDAPDSRRLAALG